MIINIERPKVMKVETRYTPEHKGRKSGIGIRGSLQYLASILTRDQHCTENVKARIEGAKSAFTKKKHNSLRIRSMVSKKSQQKLFEEF